MRAAAAAIALRSRRLRARPGALAALFGALPLMLSTGSGAELRQPLGLVMVGGLIVSQILTIFTTPVVYLYFDRLAQRISPRPVRAPRSTPSPLVPGPLAGPASR